MFPAANSEVLPRVVGEIDAHALKSGISLEEVLGEPESEGFRVGNRFASGQRIHHVLHGVGWIDVGCCRLRCTTRRTRPRSGSRRSNRARRDDRGGAAPGRAGCATSRKRRVRESIVDNSPTFTSLADLASSRVGGRALATNDDFFASKSNLLKPEPAVFIAGQVHDARQMDGRLGIAPPPHAGSRLVRDRAWACAASCMASTSTPATSPAITRHIVRSTRSTAARALARQVVGASKVRRGSSCCRSRRFAATVTICSRSRTPRPWTHLRLNIFPDGGVARLRVYGEVAVDWRRLARGGRADRSRRHPQRRAGPRRQRHALRRQGQHDHARPRGEHGRRLGDAAPARAGSRLGHRAPRARRVCCRRSRSTPITSRAIIRRARRSRDASRHRRAARGCATIESLTTASWTEILPRTKLRAAPPASLFEGAAADWRRCRTCD